MRLTPAYAGNMDQQREFVLRIQAHPRIRGEYSTFASQFPDPVGSPPHTRGILELFLIEEFLIRLTPAYAGNILPKTLTASLIKAHPRIRGEYDLSVWTSGR